MQIVKEQFLSHEFLSIFKKICAMLQDLVHRLWPEETRLRNIVRVMCGIMLVVRLRTTMVASICECLDIRYNVGANKTLFQGILKMKSK